MTLLYAQLVQDYQDAVRTLEDAELLLNDAVFCFMDFQRKVAGNIDIDFDEAETMLKALCKPQ